MTQINKDYGEEEGLTFAEMHQVLKAEPKLRLKTEAELNAYLEEQKSKKSINRTAWLAISLAFLFGFIILKNILELSILDTLGFIEGLILITIAIAYALNEIAEKGKKKNEDTND